MKNLQIKMNDHPASKFFTLELKGALKSTDAIHMKEQLCKNVDVFGSQFTIDLRQVEDVDLTGLNALVIAKQTFERAGKKIQYISSNNASLNELAQLTKLDSYLAIA